MTEQTDQMIADADRTLDEPDHPCACSTCAARIKLMQVQVFEMHAVLMPLMAAIMSNPLVMGMTGVEIPDGGLADVLNGTGG